MAMASDPPIEPPTGALDTRATILETEVMDLQAETLVVSKQVRRTLVSAKRTTQTRDTMVEENLNHDQVVVERVAIGRVVDEIPPVRQEGDVTIMSVVEEEVVVQRRLVLKEEIHLRRVHTTQRHVETVQLREHHLTVTRTKLDD